MSSGRHARRRAKREIAELREKEARKARQQAKSRKAKIEAKRNEARRKVEVFFKDAGVDVAVTEKSVRIEGHAPLALTVAEKRGYTYGLIHRIVLSRLPRIFFDSVVSHLKSHRLRLGVRMTERGVVLHEDARVVALVEATCAHVPSTSGEAQTVVGNFLTDGPQWARLVELLKTRNTPPRPERSLKPARSSVPSALPAQPSQPDSPPWKFTSLPAGLSPEQVAQALADSEQLRHDRTLEFGHPVTLKRPELSVRFEPMTLNGNALELPFNYRSTHEHLSGALRMKTPRDPLALVVESRSHGDGVIGAAWTTALRGYTELTCVDIVDVEREQHEDGGRQLRPRGPVMETRSTAEPRAPRLAAWALSSALTPIGDTNGLIASYVVGHRRRLTRGRKASSEARAHAERIGIALAPNETWVKPYLRGAPSDAELVFKWHEPTAESR